MNVSQAISKVAAEVGPVYKDSKAQGYSYRGIEDMMNALAAPLRDNGVFLVPNVVNVEHHDLPQGKKPGWIRVVLTVRYDIYGPEGDHISATVSADALDNSDKAHGKAYSYCFKLLVGQMFCIPTEDDNESFNDGDHDLKGDDKPARSGVVDKMLTEARDGFKALSESERLDVARMFQKATGIGMKEIVTEGEAKILVDLVRSGSVGGGDTNTDLDALRILIDDLEKSDMADWAKFCTDEGMTAGEPESWNSKQIESAFSWLEGEE